MRQCIRSNHRQVAWRRQPKKNAMQKIEERSTQSAEKLADASKFTKSQSLRLDKQTIRTLTGAELRLVGGGSQGVKCQSANCHAN
jgi:hypothetical protein